MSYLLAAERFHVFEGHFCRRGLLSAKRETTQQPKLPFPLGFPGGGLLTCVVVFGRGSNLNILPKSLSLAPHEAICTPRMNVACIRLCSNLPHSPQKTLQSTFIPVTRVALCGKWSEYITSYPNESRLRSDKGREVFLLIRKHVLLHALAGVDKSRFCLIQGRSSKSRDVCQACFRWTLCEMKLIDQKTR